MASILRLFLAFYLAYVLTFCLAAFLAFSMTLWHVFRSRRAQLHPELTIWLGSIHVHSDDEEKEEEKKKTKKEELHLC